MTSKTNAAAGAPEFSGVPRDPEDRPAADQEERREKMLDKTLADSFPTSDPPSTIPDPVHEDSLRPADPQVARRHLLMGLPPGSWAAISLDKEEVVGTGATRDEAERNARDAGHPNVELIAVPADTDAPLQAPNAA